jgi:hypothetical protein
MHSHPYSLPFKGRAGVGMGLNFTLIGMDYNRRKEEKIDTIGYIRVQYAL